MMNRRELLTSFGLAGLIACRGAARPEDVRTAETTVTLTVDGMI